MKLIIQNYFSALEKFKTTPQYQRARLYKYYQSCKDKLMKSPHELGLGIEIDNADPGVVTPEDEPGLVSIVAKPNEVKKFKIRLRNVRAPEGEEDSDPNSPKGIILDRHVKMRSPNHGLGSIPV